MIAEVLLKNYPKLNEAQKQIIGHTAGPLLVIAGPGSGKTFSVVLRALNILLLGKAEPRELVLCTFTEKAAFELRDRISAAAVKVKYEGDLSELRASTIHSLCNRLLSNHRHRTPLGNNYETLDDLTELLFIFDHFKEIIGEHIGPDVSHYIRLILEEVFGSEAFLNEVVWQRTDPHNDARSRFGNVHDSIYWFKKGEKQYYDFNAVRDELSDAAEKEYSLLELKDGTVVNWKGNEKKAGRRFKLENATWKGNRNRFNWRGAIPSANREWIYDPDGMEAALTNGDVYLRDPEKGSTRCLKKYLDENLGIVLQDIWLNAGRMKGGSEYPTQKPMRLLSQIVLAACPPGGLVADLFWDPERQF